MVFGGAGRVESGPIPRPAVTRAPVGAIPARSLLRVGSTVAGASLLPRSDGRP